jgi:hypothetical protein
MQSKCSLPHSQQHQFTLFCTNLKPLNAPKYLLKIRFNTILPLKMRSSKCYLTDGFSYQNTVHISPFPIRATYPAHHIRLDFITKITLCWQYRSCTSSLRSFLLSLFAHPSLVQYISKHPLACALPSMWETKYHTRINQTMKYFPLGTQNNHCDERCLAYGGCWEVSWIV